MWFHSLLASGTSGLFRNRRPQPRPARRGTRLVLEQLEDRALPSAYTAASVSALIADISAANTAGGANTISLTAPTSPPYVLTAINNSSVSGLDPQGSNGLPVIAANDNLTIVGNGDTIERSASAFFRLFDVASGGSLILENLTLQGGRVGGASGSAGPNPAGPRNNGIYAAEGGAIYNQGTLVLSGVTVQHNVAEAVAFYGTTAAGGAIFSYGGSVTLEGGAIVRNNSAYGTLGPYYGGNAYGGGLCAVGGTVTVTNATLDNNIASAGLGSNELESFGGVAYGGGLYVSGSTVNLTNATLNGNSAYCGAGGAYGGGLFLFGGTTTMTGCTVQGNSALAGVDGGGTGQGGGIYIYIGYYSGYVNTYVYLDTTTVAQVTGNTASDGATYDNIVGPYILTPAAGEPPIVANAASASPGPVTGTTTKLNVLGADAAGPSSLTYTWAVTSVPAGAATPTFSSNGSNASQSTTATFYRAGTYTFQATITDPSGLTAVSSITVTVVQTVTSLSVTPGNVTLADRATQQFTATALDQFGQALASPPTFTWQVSGGGTISSTGLYTAPKKGTGTFQVTVSADGLTAQANVTVDV